MRKKLDIVSIGEILIDFVGKEQSMRLADVTEFRRAAGGGPANMAVGAARLGAKTGFVGKVGADAFGRHLHEILEQNGVDTQGLIADPAANTTLVFVALNQQGVPDFSFFRQGTADTLLRVDELPIPLLQDTKILHFSSVSLTTEPSRSACLKAVEVAKNAGALISFDPNLRLQIWPDSDSARKEIMAAAGLANILKMNDEEYHFLTGQPIECRKKKEDVFGSDRLKLLAVTRGERGSMLFTHTDSLQFAGRKISVVDTTGAGDAFMAGMLTILAERPEMEGIDRACLTKAGQWATAAATLACGHPGGIPSLPAREEVVELAKFIEPL